MARRNVVRVDVKFVPDHKGFQRYATTSPDLREVVVEIAKGIAGRAADHAPRRKRGGVIPEGATLAESYKVEEVGPNITVGDSYGNKRMTSRVVNTKRYAAFIEFGSSDNRYQGARPLARAGAEFGDLKPDGMMR